ncbi:ruvB-like 2 [Dorcoceras hygrometricum]|uniref:RuvB-like 2 n=1 Tax=Dorcoceras hygrometricum TaxID=472368 RepID=A0A2Z7D2R6_9LAMI|nr:ruvB-like 2 [Dorcoceras hygrometricum]
MSASGESSTTIHRLLHESGSHPIPPPDDPKRWPRMIQLEHNEPAGTMNQLLLLKNKDEPAGTEELRSLLEKAIEEEDVQVTVDESLAISRRSEAQKTMRRRVEIQKSVTQLRLFVHLRSLGVLTAAGCGIGSVHAVVRSNLLVEPSEVEEGEM